jgi:hypothetical protein
LPTSSSKKHNHFFEFHLRYYKSSSSTSPAAELEAKSKYGYAKKVTFVLFRKINQLVFVSNVERNRSESNSNAGILTDILWDEDVSSIAEANQVRSQLEILPGVVIDDDVQSKPKCKRKIMIH